ncbi:MAG: hypothetical protein CO035_03930, partial [Candidatus Omnitrophica bacterium CG_4_9_14_0_2_um_filter_42_8]
IRVIKTIDRRTGQEIVLHVDVANEEIRKLYEDRKILERNIEAAEAYLETLRADLQRGRTFTAIY